MSNLLYIETSIWTDPTDGEKMVLVLAHDSYAQSFNRWFLDDFLDSFTEEKHLEDDILSWDAFDDDRDL